MGFVLSLLFPGWYTRRDVRLLMVGLDGAGKTTILYKLKLGEVVSTVPTIGITTNFKCVGFNLETVEFRGSTFTVWDVGGQDRIRALWRHYYTNSQGIIFVLDASDHDRLSTAREELSMMLSEPCLREAALLVYANKQDMPGALQAKQVAEALGLTEEAGRRWHVQGACALTGDGLIEGLSWLWSALK